VTIRELKTRMRIEARARRGARTSAEHRELTPGVTEALSNVVAELGATSVAIFLSTPSEPETRDAIRVLSARGTRCYAPISLPEGAMTWAPVDAHTPERSGLGGMPEPDVGEGATSQAITVDAVICPAAAVDESGTRLGWGGGFYDRFLGDLPAGTPVFALVFDDDVVSELPCAQHDVPVWGVVTPSGSRRFEHR
jgi:5-formyltetrahydrofolate cyclo-ligase